jgi:hypothetical protein
VDAFGPELVPTFLGGQLDYDAVRQQWLDKMDAVIAQRQQHPRGKQVGGMFVPKLSLAWLCAGLHVDL